MEETMLAMGGTGMLSFQVAVGLIFLPIIFYPILAFGSATYCEDNCEQY